MPKDKFDLTETEEKRIVSAYVTGHFSIRSLRERFRRSEKILRQILIRNGVDTTPAGRRERGWTP
jgi:hypothetical protein